MATETPSANGVPKDAVEDKLLSHLTEGYKPSAPLWTYGMADGQMLVPQFYLLREIELMMIHPIVRNALNYFKGGIAGAQFEGPKGPDGKTAMPICESPEVTMFIQEQCKRFWDRGRPKVQNGYEYGWIGCENIFDDADGVMKWEHCDDFLPRDCFMLTEGGRPIGARIKHVVAGDKGGRSDVDLWFASRDVPAKALWYAHAPRYNRYYGQSQLVGAWKPWRRLAWKDAAETVLDGGFYRAAYSGPLVRFPDEDLQGPPGSPNTTLDSQGNPRRFSRDIARQIAEQMKTGASIGLPSKHYPPDMGGELMWDVTWPENKFDGGPLLAYIEHLIKMIREGIGVPNELIEASETGSGYSGRAIPLEGFLMLQQQLADAILHLFVEQVLRPLVRWNFGNVKFEVRVQPLLETKLQMAQQAGGAPQENRAGALADQGTEGAGGQQGAGGGDVFWQPHPLGNGEQGWKSTNGLIRKGAQPPGRVAGQTTQGQFSLEGLDYDRIRRIAAEIRRAA